MFEDKISMMNADVEMVPVLPQYEKRVYTVDEIMDILGVSKTTAYTLVKSGVFRCVQVGGQYRVSKKSFDKWLDSFDENIVENQVCDS